MLSVHMWGIFDLRIYVAVKSPYPLDRDVTGYVSKELLKCSHLSLLNMDRLIGPSVKKRWDKYDDIELMVL